MNELEGPPHQSEAAPAAAPAAPAAAPAAPASAPARISVEHALAQTGKVVQKHMDTVNYQAVLADFKQDLKQNYWAQAELLADFKKDLKQFKQNKSVHRPTILDSIDEDVACEPLFFKDVINGDGAKTVLLTLGTPTIMQPNRCKQSMWLQWKSNMLPSTAS